MACKSGRERRHSLDYFTTALPEVGTDDENNRRVHFDDRYVNYTYEGTNNPSRTRIRPKEEEITTVQTITGKLKQSYENIEHGLVVLQNIRDELLQVRQFRGCSKCAKVSHVDNKKIQEIDILLKEIEHLWKLLEKAGIQKRRYLTDLSKIQCTLHKDRKKVEGMVKTSHNKNIKDRLQETSNRTREQQLLITKLKSDNAELWKTLQEIQDHLSSESASDVQSLASIDVNEEAAPKILPQNPREVNSRMSYSPNDQRSTEDSQNSRLSNQSSRESFLSERLKNLLEKSSRIQKTSKCQHKAADQTETEQWLSPRETPRDSSRSGNELRIPSENEQGVRSDMNEIMQRCEELEKKVGECSTKDIRNKLIEQLNAIEGEECLTERQKITITEEGNVFIIEICIFIYTQILSLVLLARVSANMYRQK